MKIKIFMAALLLLVAAEASAQRALTKIERDSVSAVLTRILEREVSGAKTRVVSSSANRKGLTITMSAEFASYPFREDNIRAMYDSVRAVLPWHPRNISLKCRRRNIESLIPQAYRTSSGSGAVYFVNPSGNSVVTPLSRAFTPAEGLAGRHIALWPSHGRYYEQTTAVWRWQRPRIWQTCEDLLSEGFVFSFLVPMLENAGANVFVPRERDVNRHEIIADNDGAGIYCEKNGTFGWYDGGTGFAHVREHYIDGENPFTDGTFRAVRTVSSPSQQSTAIWGADIPERGEYAVYISYKTVKNGCRDAVYTVHHAGGETSFAVDQTMGGGTWIYLGHFLLDEGRSDRVVTLSNVSSARGCVVTADAVKIGGGMGNIARTVCDSLRMEGVEYGDPVTSGLPRYCEGVRYWLQWAGFSDEVYSKFCSKNDYKDDFTSRAHWVNALVGGSKRYPDGKGLNIPIDMAMALHTDAGITDNDSIVGTLGIYCTKDDGGKFAGGASRQISRDLTDVVMSNIVRDIQATFEPAWVRRGMLDKNYYEARVPKVPTVLVELLSHQNFADMRYGLDPRFRFLAARAIYKGILQHLATQYRQPYKVAPLPVDRFCAEFADGDNVKLSWHSVDDPLEPSAKPERYILYTRIGDGGFDNGRVVNDTVCLVHQDAGTIYSYRVTAVNGGGESFPSETLAACRMPEERGRVLIINGFTRVSAPVSVRGDMVEGFLDCKDSGVPYIRDISFVGRQKAFNPSTRHDSNVNMALGASYGDYEGHIVGGNTFDYPYMHGSSLVKAGYSFCSASAAALDTEKVSPSGYDMVDYISGKQRLMTLGSGFSGSEFRVFTPAAERILRRYAAEGGALFVSGSNAVSDIWTAEEYDDNDKAFAREVLHCELEDDAASNNGAVTAVSSKAKIAGAYRFHTTPSPESYCVESPAALRPSDRGAFAVMRYEDSGGIAGVAYDGCGRTMVLGFPFETLKSESERDTLMKSVADFLTAN